MSNNKKKRNQGAQQTSKKSTPAPARLRGKAWIIAAAAVALIVVALVVTGGLGKSPASASIEPSAEEARYIGRFLPVGYQEPSVAGAQSYNSTVEMTDLTATSTEAEITLPLADVTNAKIAHFTYEGANGALPLVAYIKPSGALFVGVSFCPPCQGEWQTISSDGTLTCNSCGTKRDLETGAGISGTCKLYPLDELPVTVAAGTLTIDRAVLDSWTPQPLDRKVG